MDCEIGELEIDVKSEHDVDGIVTLKIGSQNVTFDLIFFNYLQKLKEYWSCIDLKYLTYDNLET